MHSRTILFLSMIAVVALAKPPAGYTPLFDGKTLNGWHALPGGEWSVKDGTIAGQQEKTEGRHGQLVSDKQYENFMLRLKYKALKGNSGVYFRVEKIKHAVAVKGFQAEVDATANNAAGLYETLGRAWVSRPAKEKIQKVYKMNEWNEMTVVAIGGTIKVALNGVVMTELQDDPGLKKGHLALQLHGGQDMEVYYKDIMIRELPSPAYPAIAYTIHDRSRPLPKIVPPKPATELTASAKAPANATVLFDGTNLDAWKTNWPIINGTFQTGKKGCVTKEAFGDCRLHLEWRVTDPKTPGNSGVFLMEQFEVQIFNSHNNRTPLYADGQAGSIYGQYPALVNACRPPGEWEYYDIDFTAPTFKNGQLATPARISVHQNGHLIQDNVALTGPTGHYIRPLYQANRTTGPLSLQHHGDILQFRNVWIVKK